MPPAQIASPMTTANRVSGAAPLAVFFDAVDTSSPGWSSGVTQPGDGDYASFYYRWDFGDANSGTWSTNGKSKNSAAGHLAGHLFEVPGTYRVTLQVLDAAGNVSSYYQDITVAPFGGAVYYVSNSAGSDGNDGLSANAPFKTFSKAMSVAGDGRCVLFNRGETFPTGENSLGNGTGTFIIGAYGQGANPVIQYGGSYQVLDLTYTGLQVTITDVDFAGSGDGQAVIMGSHDLVCRSHITNFSIGLFDGNGENFNDENFVVDSKVENTKLYDFYTYGLRRSAVLGCRFGDAGSTQVRLYAPKSLIGHNLFQGYALRDFLKCLGLRDSQGRNRFSIISDNLFFDPPDHLQTVMIGPENNVANEGLDQRIDDLIIERNTWNAGKAVDCSGIASNQGNRITVRNNVYINMERCIMQNVKVGEGWNTWRVYNNSAYNATSPWNPRFIEFNDGVNDLQVINNVCSSLIHSAESYGLYLSSTPLGQISEGSNIWYLPNSPYITQVMGAGYTLASWQGAGKGAGSQSVDPAFRDPAGGSLRLQASSPAVNAGLSLPHVRDDLEGRPRPAQGCDMGAYEQ